MNEKGVFRPGEKDFGCAATALGRGVLEEPDFFGQEPSFSARKAMEHFKKEGKSNILELGPG